MRRDYPQARYSEWINPQDCLCGCKVKVQRPKYYASNACRKRVQRAADREARDRPDPLTKALAEPARSWRNRDRKRS